MNYLRDMMDWIGISAPVILFIISLFLLRNVKKYLLFYVGGFGLNNLLNILLKILIKEPRPDDDTKFIELMILKGKRVGYDKYGMPSGHLQNCAFSLMFITLVLNDPWITSVYVIVTLLSAMQRYKYKNHTISQIIVGIGVGGLLAFCLYFLASKYILGKVSSKKDDNFLSWSS